MREELTVLLCGDCKSWQAWPCPRINTHRYGTCQKTGKTTRRVTFCQFVPREEIATPHRPLTPKQKKAMDMHLSGMSNAEIADKMGVTPARVRAILRAIARKLAAEMDAEG